MKGLFDLVEKSPEKCDDKGDFMTKKKRLGQFFTTNSSNILKGLEHFVVDKVVADPFAGGGDLLAWAREHRAKKVQGYDVDEQYVDNKTVKFGDSIVAATRHYEFVLTNPPYLNINKADNATKEKYLRNSGYEDLYQVSLKSILNSEEGIFIVPINFLSADNSKKIRRAFFDKFVIDEMNYFTYQVFPDTTYNVIAAHYRLKKCGEENEFEIKMKVFFEDGRKEDRKILLRREFGWGIGREFIEPIVSSTNKLGVYRFEKRHMIEGPHKVRLAEGHIKHLYEASISNKTLQVFRNNIILLKAIDSGTDAGKIALEDIRRYHIDGLVSKPTSRHMIQLVFKRPVALRAQEQLIDLFNNEFNAMREKTFSLFLTNYRDKNRKRVGFDFVYNMVNYLHEYKIQGDKSYSRKIRLPLHI